MFQSRRSLLKWLSASAGSLLVKPSLAARRRLQSPGGYGNGGNIPTTIHQTPFPQTTQVTGMLVGPTAAATGSAMPFRILAFYANSASNGNITLQMYVDETPVGSPINQVISGGGFNYLSGSLDTTAIANGTHVLRVKPIDADTNSLYGIFSGNAIIIVNNPPGTFNNGAQTIWTGGAQNNSYYFWWNDVPQQVSYGGNPQPTVTTYAYPNITVAGSNTVNRTDLSDFWAYALSGPHTQEYVQQMFFGTIYSGGAFVPSGVQVIDNNVEAPQDTPSAYQAQLGLAFTDGGRGQNYVSPFATYKESPDGTWWAGAEINGRLFRLDFDGTVTTIAGRTRDRTKLMFTQGNVPNESLFASVMMTVGNFVDPIDLGGVQDIEFDPRDSNILYLPSIIDNIIIKVDMTGWPGTPATVSRWAGTGSVGANNGAPLTATFNSPSSCCMDSSGNLYIADQQNCLIRKITTTGAGVAGIVSTVVGQVLSPTFSQAYNTPLTYSPTSTVNFADPAYVCFPSCIRMTSDQTKLVIYEPPTWNVRRIDLGTSTIHYLGAYDNGAMRTIGPATPTGWGWLGVDTAGSGMVGPLDDVIVQIPGGLQDTSWRVSATNTSYSASYSAGAGLSQSIGVQALAGVYPKIFHYNWAVEISRHEGKFITNALQALGNTVCRIKNVNDASMTNAEIYTLNSGAYIWMSGVPTCRGVSTTFFPTWLASGAPNTWPYHFAPSFWDTHSDMGAAHLGIYPGGNSFDEMNATYTTDVALAAFIQGGCGTGVPRPWITGNDMRDLIYYIRFSTATGGVYPTRVSVGADDPNTGNPNFPIVLTVSAMRNNATSITVSWTTNKPTIGFAMAGGPNMQSASVKYPCFSSWHSISGMTVPYGSDGPTSGGTVFSATIDGLPSNATGAGTPIHYSVQIRDMAGNAAYIDDQTVT